MPWFMTVRYLLPATSVLAVLVGTGGCSGPAGPVPAARVTAAQQAVIPRYSSARPGQTSGMKFMLAAVNQAVGTVHDADPTTEYAQVLSGPGEAGSLPIRTDQGLYLSAGSYTLTVYCAGNGHVIAKLWVGKATARLTSACRTVPETIRLHVRAPKGGVATVQLADGDRQPIAVAYALTSPAGTWLIG
jgi:hypothetical protein